LKNNVKTIFMNYL